MFRRTLMTLVTLLAALMAHSASLFALSAKHLHIGTDDLGCISFFAAFGVVPASGLQTAFNIDLPSFFQILVAYFGKFAPDDNSVPFRFFLPVAIVVFEAFGCSKSKIDPRLTGSRDFQFRIVAEVATGIKAQV